MQLTKDPVIELEGAAFGYEDRTVVRGVDLSISRGEVVAVLGPNGAGKSTLVRGLLGLAEQHGGRARIAGSPIGSPGAVCGVGYVPQRHTLATAVKATAAEIVTMGRTVRTPWWAPWRIHSAANRTRVAEALAVVGLGGLASHDVATLSGGQQRRVLIARALASAPEVFLMDEPTAGVDRGHQHVLVAVMRRLVARGATLVVVTHELDTLADVITRVVLVRGGRIVYDGPPSLLPPDPLLHRHEDDEDEEEEPEAPQPSPVQTTTVPPTGGA